MLKSNFALSIPVLVAGLQVVAVPASAMVSVGSVIRGLGTWTPPESDQQVTRSLPAS